MLKGGTKVRDSSMAMVNKTSVSHFKVKNTLLKHTDGKGNCLVFFKLTKEGVSLLYYPSRSLNTRNFITADRSTWPVLKRHQAAKFLTNFQVLFVLIVKNIMYLWIIYLRRFIHFEIGSSTLI